MDNNAAIDVCRKYIEAKNCSYLAKEDQVVYYSSDTGRPKDFKWHKMTLAQTHRIIQSMYSSKPFSINYLLQAFQELGKVYERGVTSIDKTEEGLFNYYENSDQDILDRVLDSLVSNLLKNDYTALFIRDINIIFSIIKADLDLYDGYTAKLYAALEFRGFDVRVQSRRPRIDGALTSCALFGSCKPKDVRFITPDNQQRIAKEVLKEFK